MRISTAFLLLVVVSPLLLAQQRMMPPHQNIYTHWFSGVSERSGERPDVPTTPRRFARPAEEPPVAPEHWGMRLQQFDGGRLALAKKAHTADTFYLPDTVIAYHTPDSFFPWLPDDTLRSTYTYDASGNMLTLLEEQWHGTQWVNSHRYTYTYDASGNMLTDLYERWADTQWVDSWRDTYTYDASGNMLTWLTEGWAGTQWVNLHRYTYTYDATGNMLTWLEEDRPWDGTQWVNVDRYTYTYDASGNMLTELREDWDGTQWVIRGCYTYTYDATGNMLTGLSEYLWRNWRYTYTYDATGNMLTWLREDWQDAQWVNVERYTYTYDASGNMLTWLEEHWLGPQWVNDKRGTHTYDASGNMLTRLEEDWAGTQWAKQWVNSERDIYTYDARGSISLFTSESWSGGTWEPDPGICRFSIGKNDYEFSGYLITLHYTEITTSVAAQQDGLATSYELAQNYPNPCNPTTTFEYTLPYADYVTLRIYNVLGEEVATLIDGEQSAGTFTTEWDASGLPSGVYFYRLTAGEYVHTRKMVLMR